MTKQAIALRPDQQFAMWLVTANGTKICEIDGTLTGCLHAFGVAPTFYDHDMKSGNSLNLETAFGTVEFSFAEDGAAPEPFWFWVNVTVSGPEAPGSQVLPIGTINLQLIFWPRKSLFPLPTVDP